MSEDTERLVRLETKMDMLLTQLPDHENRIRVLEGWRMRVIGWAAGVGLPSGFVGALFAYLINR